MATSCRCGRNAFTDGTCLFCGTGDAGTPVRARRPRHPAAITSVRCVDRRPWTQPMVIAAIRRWNRETGRPPRMTEWSRAGAWWPSAAVVQRVFATWKTAIRAAGFEPPAQGRPAIRERVAA